MTVVATAASKHDAMREIAETVARALRDDGVSAEFVELNDDVDDLRRYDAVVLGSAYLGQWLEPAQKFVERLVETTKAREHKLFGGKLDLSKLGLLEKAAVRAAHASEGDYRDWDEVERWASEIAAELSADRTPSPAR